MDKREVQGWGSNGFIVDRDNVLDFAVGVQRLASQVVEETRNCIAKLTFAPELRSPTSAVLADALQEKLVMGESSYMGAVRTFAMTELMGTSQRLVQTAQHYGITNDQIAAAFTRSPREFPELPPLIFSLNSIADAEKVSRLDRDAADRFNRQVSSPALNENLVQRWESRGVADKLDCLGRGPGFGSSAEFMQLFRQFGPRLREFDDVLQKAARALKITWVSRASDAASDHVQGHGKTAESLAEISDRFSAIIGTHESVTSHAHAEGNRLGSEHLTNSTVIVTGMHPIDALQTHQRIDTQLTAALTSYDKSAAAVLASLDAPSPPPSTEKTEIKDEAQGQRGHSTEGRGSRSGGGGSRAGVPATSPVPSLGATPVPGVGAGPVGGGGPVEQVDSSRFVPGAPGSGQGLGGMPVGGGLSGGGLGGGFDGGGGLAGGAFGGRFAGPGAAGAAGPGVGSGARAGVGAAPGAGGSAAARFPATPGAGRGPDMLGAGPMGGAQRPGDEEGEHKDRFHDRSDALFVDADAPVPAPPLIGGAKDTQFYGTGAAE